MKPLLVYTGSLLWEGRPTVRPARKGRVEHGPGIYFTTSLQTARKYAKGRGVVLQVEIDPTIGWLEGAIVPVEVLIAWVQKQPRLKHKREILTDLLERSGTARGLKAGEARVTLLVNLMVNYEAITGDHGPALAQFLTDLGIGASYISQSGAEEWIVVFDPDKIQRWRPVGDDAAWHLPRIQRS